MQKNSQTLVAIAFILGTAGIAAADNLIQNPSFEADNSERVNQPVTDWTFQSDQAGGTISSTAGTGDPSTYFPSNHSGVDGSYMGFFNMAANQANQAFPTAAPVNAMAANTTYTLTVALGDEAGTGDFKVSGQFQLQLYDNMGRDGAAGDLVAESALITPADGTMTDYSISFTTGATGVDPLVGQLLEPQIKVFTNGLATQEYQSPFDNVRLVATPEPTSLGLLSLGVLGLLRRRRA